MFVARFSVTGVLDTGFGMSGLAHTGLPGSNATKMDIAVQSDGKILVAGNHSGSGEHYVMRFDAGGEPDSSFGTNGVASSGVGSSLACGVAVAIQPDGKVLLAGVEAVTGEPYVARYDTSGTVDIAFGTVGVAASGVPGQADAQVALAVQPDGKILLAGHNSSNGKNFVARFDGTGALDGSFGGSGVAYPNHSSSFLASVEVELQPDGNILLAGHHSSANENYVTHFLANGTIDADNPTGVSGILNVPADVDLAIQADGGILLAANDNVASEDFVVRLFNAFIITSVTDVPNDQGGSAYLRFCRHALDDANEMSTPIAAYNIHRREDNPALVSRILSEGEPVTEETEVGVSDARIHLFVPGSGQGSVVQWNGLYYRIPAKSAEVWSVVGTVFAQQEDQYLAVVPTVGDSSSTIPYSVYYVSAHSTTPSIFFESDPDSGYSVDNIAPGVPQGFTVVYNTGTGNQLTWDGSVDNDFQYSRVYRSMDPGQLGAVVHATSGTNWTDPDYDGWDVYYHVTALDHAGNESDPASDPTATGVGDSEKTPSTFVLHQNVPNPFNPSTIIHYDIPAGGDLVTLRIFDVRGARVRTLFDGRKASGRHRALWDGQDDSGNSVASGVYFYRLVGTGFSSARRMVLLR